MEFKVPTENDLVLMDRLLGESFGLDPIQWMPWRLRIGTPHLRVLKRGADLLGCLGLYRFSQTWGGRRVRVTGVAGVGTSPLHRGEGLGRALFEALLNEEHKAAVPYQLLFASTRAFYRKLGFEDAGSSFLYSAPIEAFQASSQFHREAFDPPALDQEIVNLYERRAALVDGHLQRSTALWQRLAVSPDGDVRGYLVRREGPGTPVTGYVIYLQRRTVPFGFDVQVRDWVTTDDESQRALMNHIYGLRSLAKRVEWRGPANDLMLSFLPEQTWKVEQHERFLLRITNVIAALEGRGYPCADAEVRFRLVDPIIDAHNQAFCLTIRAGQARVVPTEDATLTMDIRGLSGLYTGFLQAETARVLGLAQGDMGVLKELAACFVGSEAWMPDRF